MAYLIPADFRAASLNSACAGIELTDDMANDQRLTTAIATISQRIDDKTGDWFEKHAAAVMEISVGGASRFYGFGQLLSERRLLQLPRRCTAVTTVKTRDHSGALTTQSASSYRLRSSLDPTGAIKYFDEDYIEILEWGPGITGTDIIWGYAWPPGTNTVQVTGDFGWTVTPGDIKRATALYVFDLFFKQAGDLGRVKAFTRGDIRVEQAEGVPEADAILEGYMLETPSVLIG